jgi:uncharacterized protein (DUF58 family)
MDTHELLGRITKLPIVADGLADEMLSGNYRSVFKGQGMEFEEARHYQWGDDAKAIDWNASARLGTPFVKTFREERELSILILLDVSASMNCGVSSIWGPSAQKEQNLNPYEQALLTAALIAFSCERSGQRVGAFLFDREIERVFPPHKGRRNVLAFVSAALQYHKPETAVYKSPGEHSSNLKSAIAGAGRLLKRRSMVVIISDFLCVGWEQELSDIGRKHDVIAVRVFDRKNKDLPNFGLLSVQDPETGLQMAIPTSSALFRNAWALWHRDRADLWLKLCRRAGVALIELPVDEDAAAALTRFFTGRSR